MAAVIDLNADVGESLGPWPMGADTALIPLVSSVNIACGGHAGDPVTMRLTVRLALDAGVSLGAHPGYPDLIGFGRREMQLSPDELEASVLYQVGALDGIARAEGAHLRHVKPHGALYHRIASDPAAAEAFVRAIASLDPRLLVVGPPGGASLESAARSGLQTLVEGFADRLYEPDGRLRGRGRPGAVHPDPATIANQAVDIARDHRVTTSDGSVIPLHADTLCIHGDTPGVAIAAERIRSRLTAVGVRIGIPDR